MENKEVKDSREVRRLKAKQEEGLQKLVKSFMTRRSGLNDPNGVEAERLFNVHNDAWRIKCKNFNKDKTPYKLKYEVFREIIDDLIKEEADKIKQAEEENKLKQQQSGFTHWIITARLWYKMPYRLMWYWIKSGGNHDKEIQLWKHYYIESVLNERN